MNVFPVDRIGVVRAAAAAIVIASVAPASLAQQTRAPVRLLPDEPPSAGAGAAESKPPARQAPKLLSQTPSDISVGALEEISAESVGLLDKAHGGFGMGMWESSDRAQVERLFPRLPVSVRSLAAHDLLRRLLLSAAAAPKKTEESGNFLELRFATLAAMGEAEAFTKLLAAMPLSAITPEIRRHQANLLLLAGNVEEACELIRNQVRETDSLYWQKALFVCQAVGGEEAAATLSLTLLRERIGATDPGFLALGAVLLGETTELAAPPAPGPLTTTMLLAAHVAIPPAWLADGGPAMLRAIARAEEVPLDVRLAAAEGAAVTGARPAAEVGELYSRMQFSAEELSQAAEVARQHGGPWGRALLHQASRQKQVPSARATFLVDSWRLAKAGSSFTVAARANEDALLTLPATPQLARFAPQVVRALIVTGHREAAQDWIATLSESAELDEEADHALASLMPVVSIAALDVDRNWHPIMAQRWWDSLPEEMPLEARLARAARLFMVLDALGHVVGRKGWGLLLDGPLEVTTKAPAVGVRYSMRDAARSGRVGDTILFALLALGVEGPAGASPLALGSVIRSLRAVGLEQDARALALEAVVDAGL